MLQRIKDYYVQIPLEWKSACLAFSVGILMMYLANNNLSDELALATQSQVIEEQQALIESLSVIEKTPVSEKALKKYERTIASMKQKAKKQERKIISLESQLSISENKATSAQSQLDEQIRTEQARHLERERELDAVQDELQNKMVELEGKASLINEKIADVNEWERRKYEFDQRFDDAAIQARNELKLDELMGKFNALQVDLNVLNECDKQYLYRYNEAKSTLNHIRTLIQSYKMDEEYYFYVISNDSQITAKNRKLCIKS